MSAAQELEFCQPSSLHSWNGVLNAPSPAAPRERSPDVCVKARNVDDVLLACRLAAVQGLPVSARGAAAGLKVTWRLRRRLLPMLTISGAPKDSCLHFSRHELAAVAVFCVVCRAPGSGHHYGGVSLAKGSLVIDLSQLNDVEVRAPATRSSLASACTSCI
jgi:FAD/FMN-containing dehydrogenase